MSIGCWPAWRGTAQARKAHARRLKRTLHIVARPFLLCEVSSCLPASLLLKVNSRHQPLPLPLPNHRRNQLQLRHQYPSLDGRALPLPPRPLAATPSAPLSGPRKPQRKAHNSPNVNNSAKQTNNYTVFPTTTDSALAPPSATSGSTKSSPPSLTLNTRELRIPWLNWISLAA